ncbi:MAG: hypothetical protein ACAH07_06000 [Methylophilaceae bacterium]|nr:hypothetical protein [Methyloradius sp.]
MDKSVPVTIILIENTAIDGKHLEAGTILKDVNPELAVDLAGSGKAALATEDRVKQVKDRIKAEKAAAAERAEAAAARGNETTNALLGALASLITQSAAAQVKTPAAAS